jgi:hypothetical protein
MARLVVLAQAAESSTSMVPCPLPNVNQNFAVLEPNANSATYYGGRDSNLLLSCGSQVRPCAPDKLVRAHDS